MCFMSYLKKKFGTPFVGRRRDSKLLCSLRKVKRFIKGNSIVREPECYSCYTVLYEGYFKRDVKR
jgi:hypothetical protein